MSALPHVWILTAILPYFEFANSINLCARTCNSPP